MKLKVPMVRQPKGSALCGLACVAMILQYYGMKTGLRDLRKEITASKAGTYAPQLGSYLLKKGFRSVEIVALNPLVFSLKERGASQKRIPLHLRTLKRKAKSKARKRGLERFLEFMRLGGKISVRIPSEQDVLPEIKRRRPVMALLTTNFLSGVHPANSHFNVITGYDRKSVYVNDPLWDRRGGRRRYGAKEYFYGIHANCFADLDNGSLMLVRR